MAAAAERIDRRIARLDRLASLRHADQLEYASLWRARGDALWVPDEIDDAVAVLRDRTGKRFDALADYERAVSTIDCATAVISAAWGPLQVDFVRYRTPFALLTMAEIEHDAHDKRNPFHSCFVELCERIAAAGVHAVGISIVFPGQLQPAWALARLLKQRVPGVHVTAGGPAITQVLARLPSDRALQALGSFDSAVLYEGEHALLALVRAIERGEDPCAQGRVLRGTRIDDLSILPAPDFRGLPLERYLSPELVLPYDPTRGCYWGKCAFCHYGLADAGTARYRERDAEQVVDHLRDLSGEHGCGIFYLSEDTLAPAMATKIGRAVSRARLKIKWATDMRPERGLTPDVCGQMAEGGALAVSLGVESGSPRVLRLIDKGMGVDHVRAAILNLAGAGIAVEAMAFTGFPTENRPEALETLKLLRELRDSIALFICGDFYLTHGAAVAREPSRYGVAEVWQIQGDEIGTSLFWRPRVEAKTDRDREAIDAAIEALSKGWTLRSYPWAGALSTAHSLLAYARRGAGAFRGKRTAAIEVAPATRTDRAQFDVDAVIEVSSLNEARIWEMMTIERRRVSRASWQKLAAELEAVAPAPGRWQTGRGMEPARVGRLRLRARRR